MQYYLLSVITPTDLMPDEPEATGMLALMLLVESRKPAREDADSVLVRRCLRLNQPGPYQIQAAIQAVHSGGPTTDWGQILQLHDQLTALAPGPRRLPRLPRRPAAPPRPEHGGGAGVRGRHRAEPESGGARLPRTPHTLSASRTASSDSLPPSPDDVTRPASRT